MKITCEAGKNGKAHIHVDGEYCMSVDGLFWYSLGIANGTDIDDEGLESLKREIGERRAYNKALSLIASREHSRAELISKLKLKGFGSYSEQAVERLCEQGYVDDERFAEAFARELSEKKSMGERRIREELYRRGISREIIEQTVWGLEADPAQQISELLNGRLSKYIYDDKGIRKCYNTLIRLGYSPSDIRQAFSDLED